MTAAAAAARRRWTRRRNGITASRSSGETKPSDSGASAKQHGRLARRDLAEEAGVDAVQVVAGALGLAAALEGDGDAVVAAEFLFELGFGFGDERAAVVGVWARKISSLGSSLVRVRDSPESEQGAVGQGFGDVDVEVAGVRVVHRRRHVLPVVAQRRRDLLGGGDQDRGLRRRSGRAAPGTSPPAAARRCRDARPSSLGESRRARGARAPARPPGRARCSSASPSERWVKVENQRIDSISSPKSSSRAARS